MSIDATGRAIVIWRGDSGGSEIVHSSSSTDGGTTWTGPIDVSASGFFTETQLTHDANNRALAIWVSFDLAALEEVLVSSTSTDGGTTWSAPTEFSASTSSIEYALLTGFDDAGRAIALWSEYNGDDYLVQSSTFGDPPLPDTGADLSFLGPVTALGGGLLAAGVLALLLTRRRRSA
jgi:Neuraminidase (sialidase)